MSVPIRLRNGATFYVESEAPSEEGAAPPLADKGRDHETRGAPLGRKRVPPPTKEFGHAVEVVEGIAGELAERLVRSENEMRLSQMELEVRVGFDAKGNVFLASGHASASLKLNLKWQLGTTEGE